ncbi:hypothetical protein Lal_00046462, partial [Lupinus albus]
DAGELFRDGRRDRVRLRRRDPAPGGHRRRRDGGCPRRLPVARGRLLGGGAGMSEIRTSEAKRFRPAMAWLHTWAGLVVGWVLFAVFVTGTASYYKDDISRWMRPELRETVADPARAATAAAGFLAKQENGASPGRSTTPSSTRRAASRPAPGTRRAGIPLPLPFRTGAASPLGALDRRCLRDGAADRAHLRHRHPPPDLRGFLHFPAGPLAAAGLARRAQPVRRGGPAVPPDDHLHGPRHPGADADALGRAGGLSRRGAALLRGGRADARRPEAGRHGRRRSAPRGLRPGRPAGWRRVARGAAGLLAGGRRRDGERGVRGAARPRPSPPADRLRCGDGGRAVPQPAGGPGNPRRDRAVRPARGAFRLARPADPVLPVRDPRRCDGSLRPRALDRGAGAEGRSGGRVRPAPRAPPEHRHHRRPARRDRRLLSRQPAVARRPRGAGLLGGLAVLRGLARRGVGGRPGAVQAGLAADPRTCRRDLPRRRAGGSRPHRRTALRGLRSRDAPRGGATDPRRPKGRTASRRPNEAGHGPGGRGMSAVGLLLCAALAFTGLAALALSLDRHHRAALRGPVPRGRVRPLRAAGWAGLALSFAASIALDGWNFGPVQATGAITAAALAVALCLTYRPGWLRAAALIALPLAAACLPFAIQSPEPGTRHGHPWGPNQRAAVREAGPNPGSTPMNKPEFFGDSRTKSPFSSRYENFIGGQWVAPNAGRYFENTSPITGKVVCEVARSDASDVERALDAAHAAKEAWGRTAPAERARILNKMADRMEENLDSSPWPRPGTTASRSARRPTPTSRSPSTISATSPVAYGRRKVDLRDRPRYPRPGARRRQLRGAEARRADPGFRAGADGNHRRPAAAGRAELVNGFGLEAGKPLASSPRIAKIAFTGETTTGRLIMQYASQNLIPVTLELGGKSPNIFFADVANEDDDFFDKALEGFTMFALNQGESAPARAAPSSTRLAPRPGHDDRRPGVERAAGEDPQLRRYRQAGGAECLTGGERGVREGELAEGFYMKPTVFRGHNKMRIFQEEIFGPVLSVTTFKDDADALSIANDTLYGLGAGVWTRDGTRAYRFGRAIQAGRVWTNCYHAYPAHAAFGGYKQSGIGRETHKMMLDHYQQTKNMLGPSGLEAGGGDLGRFASARFMVRSATGWRTSSPHWPRHSATPTAGPSRRRPRSRRRTRTGP